MAVRTESSSSTTRMVRSSRPTVLASFSIVASLRSWLAAARCSGRPLFRLLGNDRQTDDERRALPFFGLNADIPAVLLEDTEADAQTETCPLAHRLRREERVKDAPGDLTGDVRPGVADGHPYLVSLLAGRHRQHATAMG